MGGNALTHGDWCDSRDWENIFFNPPKAKDKDGVSPVKTCPECQAIISASCRTCKVCGYEYPPKEQEQENELGDFIVVTKNIDVLQIINANKEKKEYYPFYKIGKDLADQAKNTIPRMTNENAEFILSKYDELAKIWCKEVNKRYNQWHQTRAKEHLYNELAEKFKKWENPMSTNGSSTVTVASLQHLQPLQPLQHL